MYICELCEYKTEHASNLCIHKKSKKHIMLESIKSNKETQKYTSSIQLSTCKSTSMYTKNYNCENCSFLTKHKSSYYRHLKNCNNSNVNVKEENYKEIIEMLKKSDKEKTELLNNFMNNANTIINKAQDNTKITAEAIKTVSMSALKYANENFKEAPVLLPLENFNINDSDFNNLDDRKQLVDTLIYNAKLKPLDKLLGEHIQQY